MTAQADKGRQVAAPIPFAVAGRSESSPTGCFSGESSSSWPLRLRSSTCRPCRRSSGRARWTYASWLSLPSSPLVWGTDELRRWAKRSREASGSS
jgi:hypothetical protein